MTFNKRKYDFCHVFLGCILVEIEIRMMLELILAGIIIELV